ncbi:MAG: hypothetical protein HY830_07735 [Actinobacteria bacterium]|nr:hypothetical protein [Actinomycetota bacterium]
MTTNLTPRPLGDDDLEQALRGAFRHGADAAPAAADPWARTTRAVRRSQVRRRTAALAVAASVALVGVVGTATGAVPFLRADRPDVANPDGLRITTDDVATWPTRGDRAGDPAFVAEVRTALAVQGDVLGVLYAGGLGGESVGIGVVARPDEAGAGETPPRELVAVVRPRGGAPRPWEVVGGPRPRDGVVSAVFQAADGAMDLLVRTRTDTPVGAVSARPGYDRSGSPSRRFERLPARGGVARTTLPPGTWSLVSVLTGSEPAPVAGSVQLVRSLLPRYEPAPESMQALAADPRCAGTVGPFDVRNAVVNVVLNRDATHEPASVVPLWCRDVDGGSAALFAVTLQDGTTFVTGALIGRRGSTEGVTTDFGRRVAGDGTSDPVVLADLPETGVTQGSRFFVHAPGAASVRIVVPGTDRSLAVAARPDGDGFVELRLGVADTVVYGQDGVVVLLDADGRVTGRVPLASASEEDPLAQDLEGPVS